MVKNAKTPANSAQVAPNRLAMNRLGPQRSSATPSPARKTAEPIDQGDDIAQNVTGDEKSSPDENWSSPRLSGAYGPGLEPYDSTHGSGANTRHENCFFQSL